MCIFQNNMRCVKFCAAGWNFQLYVFSIKRIRTLSRPHGRPRVRSGKSQRSLHWNCYQFNKFMQHLCKSIKINRLSYTFLCWFKVHLSAFLGSHLTITVIQLVVWPQTGSIINWHVRGIRYIFNMCFCLDVNMSICIARVSVLIEETLSK